MCGRAGLHVLGLVSTNECPQFSTRITDVDVCRAAALMLGRTFGVSGTFAGAPRGCYSLTATGAVWFNAHATGAAAADKQLVCYTGTPAPTNVGDTNPPTRAPTFAPTLSPIVFDGTYQCGSGAATAARITVTTWPSAARVEFVRATARSPLGVCCLRYAMPTLCVVWAAAPASTPLPACG